jgi:predicted esterase
VTSNFPGTHQGQRVVAVGEPLGEGRAAMILVHGRGATAGDILSLAAELNRPGFAYLAPQAAGHTWYPSSFLAPIQQNEPYLSSALAALGTVAERVAEAGVPLERLLLLGFSQGACLTLEFAARHARRYGAVVGLTGGLIGPPGMPREYAGSFEGAPVFLGSADPDPHVPRWRVDETAAVLERMGARVTRRIYPGMGHTINEDELEQVRGMMDDLLTEGTRAKP